MPDSEPGDGQGIGDREVGMLLLFLAVLFFARNGVLKLVLLIGLASWICHRHPAAGEYLQSVEQRLDQFIDEQSQR